MSVWKPLPKESMPYTIMLFTAYSSNTSDNIDSEYASYVMPTVIENVNYTRNSIYQQKNNGIAPLGSYRHADKQVLPNDRRRAKGN